MVIFIFFIIHTDSYIIITIKPLVILIIAPPKWLVSFVPQRTAPSWRAHCFEGHGMLMGIYIDLGPYFVCIPSINFKGLHDFESNFGGLHDFELKFGATEMIWWTQFWESNSKYWLILKFTVGLVSTSSIMTHQQQIIDHPAFHSACDALPVPVAEDVSARFLGTCGSTWSFSVFKLCLVGNL